MRLVWPISGGNHNFLKLITPACSWYCTTSGHVVSRSSAMFSPMFRSQLQLTLLSRSSTYTSKLSMNLANAMSARDLKTYAFRSGDT